MLDAFKKTGGSRQQSDELQSLIAASREERAALSTMLTQVQLHSAKLASASKLLQEVDEKAGKAHTRLDEVNDRLAKTAKRTSELEAIDARIKSLGDAVSQAEKDTARLTAPDGCRRQRDRTGAASPPPDAPVAPGSATTMENRSMASLPAQQIPWQARLSRSENSVSRRRSMS